MINAENSGAASYFSGNRNTFFRILWWIDHLEEQRLFVTDFFNNVKILSVTFDQYNAFLLNKMISFFKKILLTPNF